MGEAQAKSNDDMVGVNEKVNHLASIKSKLESTLGELESGLDKEKKARATLEKQKRKVEGDLKMAQDTVADLERGKRDLEEEEEWYNLHSGQDHQRNMKNG